MDREAKITSPTRHAHSHSHIGLPVNPPVASVPIARSGSSEGPVRYRASVDSAASSASAVPNQHHHQLRGNNDNAQSKWSNQKRPQSEYLGATKQDDAEAQALDQWFNDLSNYEQTLEEMATAALDANFKEELSAIEQWFKVLSEAERTAALYSLLQSSTPVQMRFFVTVLQQMLKRDPVGQLLSPTTALSLEAQMEAKLGLKSPTPPGLNPSRQSTGEPFLSPNTANSLRDSTSSERAKLRSRTSAPANLLIAQSNREEAARWSERNSVPERRTPSPRLSVNGETVLPHSAAPQMTSFSSRVPPEAEMSPVAGGSWSSLVQTPLAPIFGDTNTFGGLSSSPSLGSSATWRSPSSPSNSGIVLDDPRKFRRSARVSNTGPNDTFGGGGALDGMYKSTSSTRQRSPTPLQTPTFGSYPSSPFGQYANRNGSPTTSTHMAAQQAALSAQQNWRATQTASPSVASPAMRVNESTQQMAQLLALQQQLQIQQLNLAAAASIAAMSPVQLLNLQQQQAATAAALLSPNRFGANFASQQQSPGLQPPLSPRRSPRAGTNGMSRSMNAQPQQQQQPNMVGPLNNGTNADEPIDAHLLEDVPAWLRSLRLHKYTTNFEKMKWQDMVRLDDAALEAHGVQALGARRKLLKVFENVRIKKGIPLPGDGTTKDEGDERTATTTHDDNNERSGSADTASAAGQGW